MPKMIKGLSLFMLAIAVIYLAVGFVMVFNAQSAPVISGVANSAIAAEVGGVIFLISGFIFFIDAILGFRSAKDPSKSKAYIVLSTLIVIVNIAEYAMVTFGGTGSSWQYIVIACLSLLGAIFARRARKDQ